MRDGCTKKTKVGKVSVTMYCVIMAFIYINLNPGMDYSKKLLNLQQTTQ